MAKEVGTVCNILSSYQMFWGFQCWSIFMMWEPFTWSWVHTQYVVTINDCLNSGQAKEYKQQRTGTLRKDSSISSLVSPFRSRKDRRCTIGDVRTLGWERNLTAFSTWSSRMGWASSFHGSDFPFSATSSATAPPASFSATTAEKTLEWTIKDNLQVCKRMTKSYKGQQSNSCDSTIETWIFRSTAGIEKKR